MQSSQVSLTNVTLNIKLNTNAGLILNKGEIVSGIVQDVKQEGLLNLMIQGKLVEALSEVTVAKGQQIYLSVEDFRDGRIYLKMVTPEALNRLGESCLADNLKSMAVNPDQQNVAIAKKLLQYGLPVNRENMSEAAKGIKILGGNSPQNVELAVFAQAGKLPVSEPTMTALSQYFSGEKDMGKLVERLMVMVNQSPDAPTGGQQAVEIKAPPQLPQPSGQISQAQPLIPEANQALKEAPVQTSANSSTAGLTQPIKPDQYTANEKSAIPAAASQEEAYEYDARTPIVSLPPKEEAASRLANSPPSGVGETTNKQILDLVKILVGELVIIIQDDPEISADKMQARTQEVKTTVKDLIMVQDVLKNLENSISPEGRELLKHLQGVEKEISAQQLVNYLGRTYAGQDNQGQGYYLSFPVQLDNQYRQFQLRVSRDMQQDNLKQAEQLSMVVALDTVNMGRVLFHVDWARIGKLGIKGVVENNEVSKFLEDNFERLIGALSSLGYQVDNRGIIVSQNLIQEEQLKPGLEQKPSEMRLLRIDITV